MTLVYLVQHGEKEPLPGDPGLTGRDLALHPVEQIEPSPAFLHAGFRVATPDEVRACWPGWKPTA